MKRTAIIHRTRTPLQRSGNLRPMSAKRQREARIYAKKRKEFLAAYPTCWVWIRLGNDGEWALMYKIWGSRCTSAQPSDEVHHTAGRVGANYLNESLWMPVSFEAHRFIHENPKTAREKGWLL